MCNISNFCISLGISATHPTGLRWVKLSGALKYVSGSSYDGSIWGVNKADNIYYRHGARLVNIGYTPWTHLSKCSKTCDGFRYKYRYCIKYAPGCGRALCLGKTVLKSPCSPVSPPCKYIIQHSKLKLRLPWLSFLKFHTVIMWTCFLLLYSLRFKGLPRWPRDFKWSHAGRIKNRQCLQILERADPHTWSDNFLCWTRRQYNPGFRWSSAGNWQIFL